MLTLGPLRVEVDNIYTALSMIYMFSFFSFFAKANQMQPTRGNTSTTRPVGVKK